MQGQPWTIGGQAFGGWAQLSSSASVCLSCAIYVLTVQTFVREAGNWGCRALAGPGGQPYVADAEASAFGRPPTTGLLVFSFLQQSCFRAKHRAEPRWVPSPEPGLGCRPAGNCATKF